MYRNLVTVVGFFAPGQKVYSGQIAKVRDYYYYCCKYFGKENVKGVDTSNWKRKLLSTFINLLFSCCRSQNVILMLCGNGRKTILPFVVLLKKVFKFNIFYSAVGDIQTVYDKEFILRSCLWDMNGIYVETLQMVEFFRTKGYPNVKFMPVFSKREYKGKFELPEKYDEPIKLCTYSRVCAEKGISDAIDAVIEVNRREGRRACTLDIYGPPIGKYREEFKLKIKESDGCAVERPLLTDENAINTLAEHYIMLFPTWWKGEGFPIALIECYKAGLPVIATDWNFNSEIIHDNITGMIYPAHNNEALVNIIISLIHNQEKVYEMKNNCIKESMKYKPEKIMNVLFEDIEHGANI